MPEVGYELDLGTLNTTYYVHVLITIDNGAIRISASVQLTVLYKSPNVSSSQLDWHC